MSSPPAKLFGLIVKQVCDQCGGDGVLWEVDDEFTTHWGTRCPKCNCLGLILDVPVSWMKEPDPDDEVPF